MLENINKTEINASKNKNIGKKILQEFLRLYCKLYESNAKLRNSVQLRLKSKQNISACSPSASPQTSNSNFVEVRTAAAQSSENVTALTLNSSYTVATYAYN